MNKPIAILIAILLFAVLSVRCKGDDSVMLKVCPTPPPDAVLVPVRPTNPAVLSQAAQDQRRTAERKRRQNIVKGFIAVSVTVTVIRW